MDETNSIIFYIFQCVIDKYISFAGDLHGGRSRSNELFMIESRQY